MEDKKNTLRGEKVQQAIRRGKGAKNVLEDIFENLKVGTKVKRDRDR